MNHINFNKGSLNFSFLPTGDIYQIRNNQFLINQLTGNYLDGSLMNIYLRVFEDNAMPMAMSKKIYHTPLLGINSSSVLYKGNNKLVYKGTFRGITYQVTFTLANEHFWFYHVSLNGEGTADLIYGQDLGLASEGAVISNEAYVSQYIDHSITKQEPYGFVITSRQNQPDSRKYPHIQHGCLTGCKHYSTDGFQFYGLSYKETNIPYALTKETLADEVYQYEFAFVALQTEKFILSREQNTETTFYGYFNEHMQIEDNKAVICNEAMDVYQLIEKDCFDKQLESFIPKITRKKISSLEALSFTSDETNLLYPNKIFLETKDADELSFFTEKYEHVVTKEKELLVERPHALIIQTGHTTLQNEKTLATTCFMYGIFNSQIVLGNTNFHKLTTNVRNALNIFKTSGQRIYIKSGDEYKLLALPSLFEMGINYCKWLYKTETDIIEIITSVVVNQPKLIMQVKSRKGLTYEFYITNDIICGENENSKDPVIHKTEHGIIIKPNNDTIAGNVYPNMEYYINFGAASYEICDDSIFYEDDISRDKKLLILTTKGSECCLTIAGSLDTSKEELDLDSFTFNFEEEKRKYYKQHDEMLGHFRLYHDSNNANLNEDYRMNITVWWYLQNALIHYASPHGIEQYGGAAWGARDACQGPFELMIALGKYDEAKSILLKMYSHQFESTGDWPQWFMFDRYINIQAGDSHGDIIVWPLKALSDYIEITGDYKILTNEIPYCCYDTKQQTIAKEPLINHVKKEIEHILSHTMFDTALSNYGNGDWDDTLQPDNPLLKEAMVSSWTVALTYQAIRKFAILIEAKDPEYSRLLTDFYLRIESDFRTYLIGDGIVSGFAVMNSKEDVQFLLHPRDSKTGITYRLLPMTRSMIAELFTEEEVKKHTEIIWEHLKYNDGVRLMNQPVKYLGGKTVYFKRGEQASNFGREIGLLYTHATIRYSEAMSMIGNCEEAIESLKKITPVGIGEIVENAEYRQSNLYFSSSDAAFLTRYQASEEYHKLKTKEVKVKGGWRLYSSGPGIYIKQLLLNCLGVRRQDEYIIFDPTMPESYTYTFMLDKHPVTYRVIRENNGFVSRVDVNNNSIPIIPYSNKYRATGAKALINDIYKFLLNDSLNFIEIHI